MFDSSTGSIMEEQTPVTSSEQAVAIQEKVPVDNIVASGVTALGAVNEEKPKEREIAYVIKDAHFDDFAVYASANAWWMDRTKVEKLIEAFKMGHMVETAKFYAGVSKRQYQYFNELHPDFCSLIQEIKAQPVYIKAMNSVVGGLDSDPKLAMVFLRSHHPEFRSRKKGEDEVVSPVVQQTVQVAVSQNVDTTKIKEQIARIADAILIERRTGASA